MKNFYLLLATLLFFNFSINAQFWSDFEDCTGDGVPFPYEGNPWTDWGCGGGVGCAIICSTTQAHSGDYSGLIPGDGTTDAVLDLGNKIFDTWGLEFWMYIPSDKVAYWNLQGQVPIGAGEWIVGNVFFNQDNANPGVGLIDDTALGALNFNFPHDQWFKVVMNWDILMGISLATWQFNVDGVDVVPFGTPFTNNSGNIPSSLGGIDFFSISVDNELYLDDFNYVNGFIDPEPNPGPFTDDMEYPNGPPYGDWWVPAPLIGGGIGTIPGDGTTDALLDLGNQTSGLWALEFWQYIPSGYEAYWNLQGQVPIGAGEWIVGNIFFNQDLVNPGQGLIDDTALGAVSFNFPHDQWFRVVMNWDITNGISQATWQFNVDGVDVIPAGTPFTNNSGTIPTSLGGIDFYSISSDNELYLDDFNYVNGILSVNENSFLEIVVYPNPTQNTLNISTQESIKSITVYNIQGSIVKEISGLKSIDVTSLSAGLYFVEVYTDTGRSVQKFIKK